MKVVNEEKKKLKQYPCVLVKAKDLMKDKGRKFEVLVAKEGGVGKEVIEEMRINNVLVIAPKSE